MLGVTQRRCFPVDGVTLFADVGIAQDAQPLGVGRHDAVFDTVVDHLDEVAGAIWTAVQITQFGGTVELFAPRGARDVATAPSQALEDRIEMLDRVRVAPDHQAVASLQAPYASASPHVHIVNSLRR